MTEQLTIARIGHRGDGIADTNTGPVFVPFTLPGETVTVEPCRRPSRPPPSAARRTGRAHERVNADLQAFRHLRRLRHAALVARRISAVEAQSGRRGAGTRRADRAGRTDDRRARQRPPPRGAARAARQRRYPRSRLHRAAHAPDHRHRRMPDPGAGLEDGAIQAAWAIAELLKPTEQAARYSGHRHRQRHGYRRARRRSVVDQADGGAGAHRRRVSPRPRHAARRNGAATRAADAQDRPRLGAAAARALSCRRPPKAKRHWRGWSSPILATTRKSSASPICFAASVHLPCGWPRLRASPRSTAKARRSRRWNAPWP